MKDKITLFEVLKMNFFVVTLQDHLIKSLIKNLYKCIQVFIRLPHGTILAIGPFSYL